MMVKVETESPLAVKTTLKIGGNAAFFLHPDCIGDILESVVWARQNNLPVLVVGNGSNLIISDKGWPGLALEVGSRFDRIVWDDSGSEAVCQSGVPLSRLVRETIERKRRGVETLGGIPGTVGGALVMNAGAYGHSISECVMTADYYDVATGILKTVDNPGLEAGYRRTVFSTMQAIVLSGRFKFEADVSGKAREVYNECLVKRKKNHPLELPNCGSVFKNPHPLSAGALIESSGLKGHRIGDMEISTKHANFIVNRGRATAADARRLVAYMQKTVYEKKGILLEPEVVFIGEFDEPLFTPP
jgi:UDP-N-acetylmuramate dehydrogenase